MRIATAFSSPLIVSTLVAGCGLDGHHADLTAVHQGTPGCLDAACHPGFTAAGTVFLDLEGQEPVEDVEITLLDAAGGETRVATSGPAGLFYAEHYLPAGRVSFRVGDQLSLDHQMPDHAECNLCHVAGGEEGAQGTLVGQDVFPPQLSSSSPASGSEAVDPETELVLVFSEPLASSSVDAASLRLLGPDGSEAAEILFSEGADTVVLRPESALREGSSYQVVLERSISDEAGNGLAAQQVVELSTASEGSPRVTASQPEAGAREVDPATSITLWVEPGLDASSVGTGSVWLSAACAPLGSQVSYNAEERAVLLQPLQELPGGTTCAVTVDGLLSAEGVPQDGAWTMAFSTWADGSAPQAQARVPAPGRQAVSPDACVQIAWSEPLAAESVPSDALRVSDLDGKEVEGSTVAEDEGRVLRWTAATELPAGSTVLAELSAAPADAAGNQVVQPAPWSFVVGAAYDRSGPTVQGMDPAEGTVDVPLDRSFSLRLSEDPDLSTLDAGVTLSSEAGEVPVLRSWNAAESELELQPLADLSASTLYEVTVSAALLDLSGNGAQERSLRLTTVSSGDAGAPIFDGIQSLEGYDSSTLLAGWNPATDFETPASQIVYHAYLATESGGQDLEQPTASSEPGDSELELGGLVYGTTYYVVVRAEDEDGNQDENTVELAGATAIGFAGVVHPIILDGCYDCHGGNYTYADLDVSTYDSLMSSGTVVPYDSASSTFLTVGSHHGSGWFTPSDEALIADWIDEGALDN